MRVQFFIIEHGAVGAGKVYNAERALMPLYSGMTPGGEAVDHHYIIICTPPDQHILLGQRVFPDLRSPTNFQYF
jgi:hypothetical protein